MVYREYTFASIRKFLLFLLIIIFPVEIFVLGSSMKWKRASFPSSLILEGQDKVVRDYNHYFRLPKIDIREKRKNLLFNIFYSKVSNRKSQQSFSFGFTYNGGLSHTSIKRIRAIHLLRQESSSSYVSFSSHSSLLKDQRCSMPNSAPYFLSSKEGRKSFSSSSSLFAVRVDRMDTKSNTVKRSKKKVKGNLDFVEDDYYDNRDRKLIIVESPTKASTIRKFLPEEWDVDFCVGHIRELPKKKSDISEREKEKRNWKILGVNVDNGFQACWVTLSGKEEILTRLKRKSAKCKELYLATDEDREGEAISWHLVELLKPKIPTKRAVFHEITPHAINEALDTPRNIDENLVEAQHTRRVLDRVAGYTMSPMLWNKISRTLSAGRVQSAALALLVDREKERMKFCSARYLDLFIELTIPDTNKAILLAKLTSWKGKMIASTKSFDPTTGELLSSSKGKTIHLTDQNIVEIEKELKASSTKYYVENINANLITRKAPVPYITSTLQQDANSKLGFTTSKTMSVAQSLYEKGHITYMRTDNPNLSVDACKAISKDVTDLENLQEDNQGNNIKSIAISSSSKKNRASSTAQEAHEAIRPTINLHGRMKKPFMIKEISNDELELYNMIYVRTLASVMEDALVENLSILISVSLNKTETSTLQDKSTGEVDKEEDEGSQVSHDDKNTFLTVSTSRVKRKGYLHAYEIDLTTGTKEFYQNDKNEVIEYKLVNENDDDVDMQSEDNEEPTNKSELRSKSYDDNTMNQGLWKLLPKQYLKYSDIISKSHQTSPRNRYSQGTFVKELERLGIGRPSTYSAIIETLKARNYISYKGKSNGTSMTPTLIGMAVIQLLSRHFPNFINANFTKQMEDALDSIASGSTPNRINYLTDYYNSLVQSIERVESSIDRRLAKRVLLAGMRNTRIGIFIGPFGAYIRDLVPGEPTDEMLLNSTSESVSKSNLNFYSEIDKNANKDNTIKIKDGHYFYTSDSFEAAVKETRKSSLSDFYVLNPSEITGEAMEQVLDMQTYGIIIGDHHEKGGTILYRTTKYGGILERYENFQDIPYYSSRFNSVERDQPCVVDDSKKMKKEPLESVTVKKDVSVEDLDLETAISLLDLPKVLQLPKKNKKTKSLLRSSQNQKKSPPSLIVDLNDEISVRGGYYPQLVVGNYSYSLNRFNIQDIARMNLSTALDYIQTTKAKPTREIGKYKNISIWTIPQIGYAKKHLRWNGERYWLAKDETASDVEISLDRAIEIIENTLNPSKQAQKKPKVSKAKESNRKTKEEKVKRKPNPYINFCSKMRPLVPEEVRKEGIGSVTKYLSKQWKELNTEEKEKYRL